MARSSRSTLTNALAPVASERSSLLLSRRRCLQTLILLATTPVLPAWAQGGLDVGQQAPDFSAAGSDGQALRLSAMTAANRATVVHFWATWCAPCMCEMPELDVLYRKLKVQGMTLLAVNVKEAA